MRRGRAVLLAMALGGLGASFWLIPQVGIAKPVATSSVRGTIPIATVLGNTEEFPAVAYDEGRDRYLVVYQNDSTINGICLTAAGDTVAAYAIGTGVRPDVAYNVRNDQYLVVWDDTSDIEGAYVSGTCCMDPGCNGAPFPISYDRPGLEFGPAVAYNHHPNYKDYLVVWTDDGNLVSHWAIYGRRVTSSYAFSGSSFAITETTAAWNYDPDVAYNLNMNEYLVVYISRPFLGSDLQPGDVYGRRVYNAGGGGLHPEQAIDTSAGHQDQPSVAAYHLNASTPYVVVFRDYWNDTAGDVRGYLANTNGAPVSLLHISTEPLVPETQPDIASSDAMGGYVVAWTRETMPGADIYARRMSSTGVMEDVIEITALSNYEEEAVVAGGVPVPIAVWHAGNGADMDVYGRFLYRQTYLPLTLRGME